MCSTFVEARRLWPPKDAFLEKDFETRAVCLSMDDMLRFWEPEVRESRNRAHLVAGK